ncbi:hypothetical protein NC652_031701 [Populus alba x Populus x berolinensis]|nr:hypothetical protein NC652_031701 [Populus alba x Populus x berolinensis]
MCKYSTESTRVIDYQTDEKERSRNSSDFSCILWPMRTKHLPASNETVWMSSSGNRVRMKSRIKQRKMVHLVNPYWFGNA